MAGIKSPILDIITKLKTLVTLQTVRIWNNQIAYERDGKLYDFAKPAVFLEVVNDVKYNQLGEGYQSADVGWRIHLVHEFYDAQDGTFEQDLPVFDLRDSIVTLLSLYEPTGCGPLVRTSETQDYEHDNIYHFIIDFVCNFTDSKGSKDDQGKYVEKTPPIDLQLDVYAPRDLLTINYERTYPFTYTATSDGEKSFYLQPSLNVDKVIVAIIGMVQTLDLDYDPDTFFVTLKSWMALNAGQTILIIYTKTA